VAAESSSLWAVRGDRRGMCPDGEEANSEDGEEAAVMGKKHGGYASGELFAILELRTHAAHFSRMTLFFVSGYSCGIEALLTRINEGVVPFLPPVSTRVEQNEPHFSSLLTLTPWKNPPVV
jgi:hypothetical protein